MNKTFFIALFLCTRLLQGNIARAFFQNRFLKYAEQSNILCYFFRYPKSLHFSGEKVSNSKFFLSGCFFFQYFVNAVLFSKIYLKKLCTLLLRVFLWETALKITNTVLEIGYASGYPYFHGYYILFLQGGLNKKGIQLNLRNTFSIFVFNELCLFA